MPLAAIFTKCLFLFKSHFRDLRVLFISVLPQDVGRVSRTARKNCFSLQQLVLASFRSDVLTVRCPTTLCVRLFSCNGRAKKSKYYFFQFSQTAKKSLFVY